VSLSCSDDILAACTDSRARRVDAVARRRLSICQTLDIALKRMRSLLIRALNSHVRVETVLLGNMWTEKESPIKMQECNKNKRKFGTKHVRTKTETSCYEVDNADVFTFACFQFIRNFIGDLRVHEDTVSTCCENRTGTLYALLLLMMMMMLLIMMMTMMSMMTHLGVT